jgi:hypothetical protein
MQIFCSYSVAKCKKNNVITVKGSACSHRTRVERGTVTFANIDIGLGGFVIWSPFFFGVIIRLVSPALLLLTYCALTYKLFKVGNWFLLLPETMQAVLADQIPQNSVLTRFTTLVISEFWILLLLLLLLVVLVFLLQKLFNFIKVQSV